MLDRHGVGNTTNACNSFIVRKGVSRQKVINLCRDNGIPVFEKTYSHFEAKSAVQTDTFGAQTPVAKIDGKSLYKGWIAAHTA